MSEKFVEITRNLRNLELKILDLINDIELTSGPEISEVNYNLLTTFFKEYTKQTNLFLDEYRYLDYYTNKEEKIERKARIKYSNYILDLISRLFRFMNESDSITTGIQMNFEKLDIAINSYLELIEGKYKEIAQKELENFYNKAFHTLLEENINRFKMSKPNS